MQQQKKWPIFVIFFFPIVWVKEPRHSETIFANKRYTLIYRNTSIVALGSRSPVVQKPFPQNAVYLNTSIVAFGLRSLVIHKHFRQKTVYLDTSIVAFGLRSPVIQKPFPPKNGIP